ncbi:MAG: phosphatidate cytidylyltransferase [Clostridia bacterium]|nr:phosphatidate cytidylyltransferase [Clostridia bacterium]
MRTRVITAVVAIGLFIPLLFVWPPVVLTAVMGVFCAVGTWELLYAVKAVDKHIFLYISCAAAFCVPFSLCSESAAAFPFLAIMFAYMVAAFACGVFDHRRITHAVMAKGFLAAIIFPALFASVLRILTVPDGAGRSIVLMPWVTVWVCDSAALFVGRAIGKRKLAPYVSPKKTVAGGVGGLIGGVVAMIAYVLIGRHFFELQFDLLPAAIYGLFGAAVGQLGDLSLSVIKREAGIKDYGKLFPGHGGVWDRFDSILFASPLFELVFIQLPKVIK